MEDQFIELLKKIQENIENRMGACEERLQNLEQTIYECLFSIMADEDRALYKEQISTKYNDKIAPWKEYLTSVYGEDYDIYDDVYDTKNEVIKQGKDFDEEAFFNEALTSLEKNAAQFKKIVEASPLTKDEMVEVIEEVADKMEAQPLETEQTLQPLNEGGEVTEEPEEQTVSNDDIPDESANSEQQNPSETDRTNDLIQRERERFAASFWKSNLPGFRKRN